MASKSGHANFNRYTRNKRRRHNTLTPTKASQRPSVIKQVLKQRQYDRLLATRKWIGLRKPRFACLHTTPI